MEPLGLGEARNSHFSELKGFRAELRGFDAEGSALRFFGFEETQHTATTPESPMTANGNLLLTSPSEPDQVFLNSSISDSVDMGYDGSERCCASQQGV